MTERPKPEMRDKRDRQKKRFIEALTLKGTVYHASQAAGVSRQAAYRWRHEDLDFADQWDEAIENAVDEVEQFATEGFSFTHCPHRRLCGTVVVSRDYE